MLPFNLPQNKFDHSWHLPRNLRKDMPISHWMRSWDDLLRRIRLVFWNMFGSKWIGMLRRKLLLCFRYLQLDPILLELHMYPTILRIKLSVYESVLEWNHLQLRYMRWHSTLNRPSLYEFFLVWIWNRMYQRSMRRYKQWSNSRDRDWFSSLSRSCHRRNPICPSQERGFRCSLQLSQLSS